MMYFDPLYMLFIALPCMALAGWAQWRVKSAYARASKVRSRNGYSGAQAAQRILDANGIHNVTIETVGGFMSDHYDPRHKVLRLSPDVYQGQSLAAVGIAAHEVGHAIQDAREYSPLVLRNAIVPMAGIGTNFSWILIMAGLIMGAGRPGTFGWYLLLTGIAFFAMVVLFQIVNLPVEFNASKRARQVLLSNGIVTRDEDPVVGSVLNAAAMTYVAATITAVLTLLYYLWRSGLIGGRR